MGQVASVARTAVKYVGGGMILRVHWVLMYFNPKYRAIHEEVDELKEKVKEIERMQAFNDEWKQKLEEQRRVLLEREKFYLEQKQWMLKRETELMENGIDPEKVALINRIIKLNNQDALKDVKKTIESAEPIVYTNNGASETAISLADEVKKEDGEDAVLVMME
jgi:hypothetical protein